MKAANAVAALSALAQESRLAVYRALVQAGPDGLQPSDLTAKLDVAPATLSFHLAQLRHAGLITVTRHGRALVYAANFTAMNSLLGYLTENCCGGDLAACGAPQCAPTKPEKRLRAGGRIT